MKVTLMGLGTMGLGMAQSLLRAGFALTVFNRSRERAQSLAGATIASSPVEAAGEADLVISMVADDRASREVWLGDTGALASARPGSVLVECSTLSVDWVQELNENAAKLDCPLLDAPVTGSKPQAEAGQLLFLVGGDAEALRIAQPAFDAMGRGTMHLGPTGSGALMKLVNNFVCGVQAAALAEAIGLIESSSLNPQTALQVLLEGAPGSPLVKTLAERMSSRDYDPRFALELMDKDLAYAVHEAGKRNVSLETAKGARQHFGAAQKMGLGRSDFSSVVEALRPAAKRS